MSEKSKVTQEELIGKIKEWSKNYKQARKKLGIDFDELNLEELIMEYDWDTEFLFLATDLVVFVKNSFQIDKLKSAHLLVFYSELVCNTLDIIKDFGVEPYEAIN